MRGIRRWFEGGSLDLVLAAAFAIVGYVNGLWRWLKDILVPQPFEPPQEVSEPRELPLIFRGALQVAEEFRRDALPQFGETWWVLLPHVPLSKKRCKSVVVGLAAA